MKKLLVILMSLIFAFSLFGCEKVPRPSSEKEPESESYLPLDPIVACGTVNLADEIALFPEIFDNDFINITAVIQAPVGGEYYDLGVTLNARRTEKGYDVVIAGDFAGWHGMEIVVPYFRVWYIDGYYAYEIAEGPSVGDMAFEGGKGLTFNQFISLLNEKIYHDDALRLTYQAFKPEFANAVKGFEPSSGSVSLSGLYDELLDIAEGYMQKPVYEYIVEGLCGLNLTDEESINAFESKIIEICSGNPSVAALIDRVVALANEYLPAYAQIDLKGIVDGLQTALGYTTAEIVDMLKAETPDLESTLRNPKDGETLYDYFRSFLRLISVDMLAQQIGGEGIKTFDELVGGWIDASKQVNLEDFIEKLPEYLDALAQNIDEEYRQKAVEVITQIKNYIQGQASVIPRLDANAVYSFVVDENSRPKAFGCRWDAVIYPNEYIQGLENGLTYYAGLTLEFDYEDQGVEFKMPCAVELL